MNKLNLTAFTLTTIISACQTQHIKRTTKPTPDLLVETMCESQNGIFHYYRIFKASNLTPENEMVDKGDDGTLDYTRQNDMWCPLYTNNTPEYLRENKIITNANCQELFDPLGTPMKKYWESSFYTSDHP